MGCLHSTFFLEFYQSIISSKESEIGSGTVGRKPPEEEEGRGQQPTRLSLFRRCFPVSGRQTIVERRVPYTTYSLAICALIMPNRRARRHGPIIGRTANSANSHHPSRRIKWRSKSAHTSTGSPSRGLLLPRVSVVQFPQHYSGVGG